MRQVDSNVRAAFEITGENLSLTDHALRFLTDFSTHVASLLFGGRKLKLELSKLNVYPQHGHFKAHIDTPRDGMLGTVLVELPYQYSVCCVCCVMSVCALVYVLCCWLSSFSPADG